MKLIHVLSDQTPQPSCLFPLSETEMVDVWEEARPARPAYKVPGPVALSGRVTLQEDFVLDGSLAGGGVQSHPLTSVVRDTALGRDTCYEVF